MGKPKDPAKEAEWRRKISEALRGHPVSEETRRKIGAGNANAQIGNKNAAGKRSEEQRRRISEAHKGIRPTAETRRKMSEAQRGRRMPEEAVRRIAAANRGKKLSQETRERISRAQRGKKRGPLPEKTRRKIGESNSIRQRLRFARMTPEEKRRVLSKWIKAGRKASQSRSPSGIEEAVSGYLERAGVRHLRQVQIGPYLADILIPSMRLIIECDGCYWHGCPVCQFNDPPRERDHEGRDAYLRGKGYEVVHLWEHEIRSDVAETVERALGRAG